MGERKELPQGWRWIKLSDVVQDWKEDIVSGPFGSNLVVADYTNEGVPIIRLQNIQRMKFVNSAIKYVTPEKAEELKRHSYLLGDIVIAKLGEPVGKTCIVPKNFEKGIIVADVVRVRINEKENDVHFLEYILNSNLVAEQLNSKIIGSTRPRVNLYDVRDLVLPVPNKLEQQKIASKLDKQMAQIEMMKKEAEKQSERVNNLMNSYLNELYQKYSVYLTFFEKYIVESNNGYGERPKGVEEGPVVLRIADVSSGQIDYSNSRRGNVAPDMQLKYKLNSDDLIFIRVNGSRDFVGRCILFNNEIDEPVLFNDHLIRVQVNDEFIPGFVKIWCETPFIRRYMADTASTSAGQLTINRSILNEMPIPKIDKATQKGIIEYYRKLHSEYSNLKKIIEDQLNAIDQLPASILNEVFGQYQINS